MKITKKSIALIAIPIALILLAVWIFVGNTWLQLNTYTVVSHRLPTEFIGYRIAHVSDLHNAEMGDNNEDLLEMLKNAKPDMIAITGDLIDSRNTDVEIALNFAKEAMQIAPCYFVPGNHESRVPVYNELSEGLAEAGVTVLENEKTTIEVGGKRIHLIGVNDPAFINESMISDEEIVGGELDYLLRSTDFKDEYTVLLSHRPELFELYAENNIDLVFTGHAHGGQFRLPFIGGLIAPHQGVFPQYDSGMYTKDNTNMLVSRGIGNSVFPFRFNNPPEVILVELQGE